MIETLQFATEFARATDFQPEAVAPPGSEFFIRILNWVLWIAIGLGALGLIFSIIGIAMGVLDGRSSQGFKNFLIVCAALVMLGGIGEVLMQLLT